MSDDWLERPLDLLLGYEPGMRLPKPRPKNRLDHPWHPEDATQKRRTLDVHVMWCLTHERGLAWRTLNFRGKRYERNDKVMRDARKLTRKLLDEGRLVLPDDLMNQDAARAEEALSYLVAVVKDSNESTKDRLSAARAMLDFTRVKPASKTDVTIKRAEDFLDGFDA